MAARNMKRKPLNICHQTVKSNKEKWLRERLAHLTPKLESTAQNNHKNVKESQSRSILAAVSLGNNY